MITLDPAETARVHEALRRRPDVEHPSLTAVDAADRLLLDEAAPALARLTPSEIVVIGDAYGALALPLAAAIVGTNDGDSGASLRVHQDLITSEAALLANAADLGLDPSRLRLLPLGSELLAGARLVLLRLPRALAALEEIAQLIAVHAADDVEVVAAGRDKYMTPAMNAVLARSFGKVSASRGRQKSRALHASAALRPAPVLTHPHTATLTLPGVPGEVTVVAHGGAFAGPALDLGTRVLLAHLGEMNPGASTAVDLGSGTGLLAAALTLTRPEIRVTALDASWAAVDSSLATARANGVAERVEVRRADALAQVPESSVDLIVCNPPFHTGSAVLPDIGLRMLGRAGRVLRPGGELWTVFNSNLGHAKELRRLVGQTQVISDDGRFTVTRSVPRVGRD